MKFIHKYFLIVLIPTILILGFFLVKHISNKSLTSRFWMEYAEDIVREKKPSPPASARFYAYVSSVYYTTLSKTQSEEQASLATAKIINFLFTDKVASTTDQLLKLKIKTGEVHPDTQAILDIYIARQNQDVKQAVTPNRLTGDQYWVGEKPAEPSAGTWQRWVIGTTTYEVLPPPTFKSKEYLEAVAEVKRAASMRTSIQSAAINFWGGTPGTEAPAGIWQNVLYTKVQKEGLSNMEYAYVQMVLAQTLADAFMECWKVKYVYWTKRPSMVDSSIDLAMKDPPFPSYLSGHSTISRAAAGVLSVMLPKYKDEFLAGAEEAKNSRLWAGIHFPYDNENGAELGRRVAETVVENLKLTKTK